MNVVDLQMLKRYANNEVVEFDYDSEKDKLSLVV